MPAPRLATGVDHHYLERWGSLLAASFMEGYGNAIRNGNRITSVGPLGNVVSVPKDGLSHGEIAREALGTVGQRMGGAVAESFGRPNTITVAPGTGLGVLIVAPQTERPDAGDRPADGRGRATPAAARPRPPTVPAADGEPPPLGPAVVLPPVPAAPRESGRPAPGAPTSAE